MAFRQTAMQTAIAVTCLVRALFAVTPTADEMVEARQWAAASFGTAPGTTPTRPPFSFVYDGKPSSQLFPTWKQNHEERQLDEYRTEHTLAYTDPQSGLVVRCVVITYADSPAMEWLLYFKNAGPRDTPIIENVQALDVSLPRGQEREFLIHHARGSQAAFSDYAPLTDAIPPAGKLSLHSHGWPTSLGSPSGSPSVENLPFFNIQWGKRGVIAALGWTGPWIAEFHREGDGPLAARAGMDRTHLVLHKHEEIRSPRVLVLFWQQDRARGHNLWRRLLLAHYSPKPAGKPFTGLICDANWGSWMTADNHIKEINWWHDHQLPMECYWMDAGWTDMSKGWEAHQSQQVPNKALFPQGLRPVSDAARQRGMKFLLWFVPDSVHPSVGIGADHPEWLSKPFSYPPAFGNMVFYGLDYGNPTVNRFMIDYFSRIITDYGIDVFRQDGLGMWPADADPVNRSGINQIRSVEGLYTFWDGLLKNNPGLLIDNCGCGGRKLDLETIRRSIVLWRSDSQASGVFDPVSTQAFNYGLFPWIPLNGGAVPMVNLSPYSFRSAYCPAMLLGWPMANISDPAKERWSGVDMVLLRRLLNEYLAVRHYLFGDYYPLTSYSLEQNVWAAWQFDRPDLGEGMVQAFRRGESPYEAARFRLRELDPRAQYAVTDLDANKPQQISGRELAEKGLLVSLPNYPGAAVVLYKKVP